MNRLLTLPPVRAGWATADVRARQLTCRRHGHSALDHATTVLPLVLRAVGLAWAAPQHLLGALLLLGLLSVGGGC